MENLTPQQLAEKIQEGLKQGYELEDIKKLTKKQGFDDEIIKQSCNLLVVKYKYPLWQKIIFWIFWLFGLGLFILGAGCGLAGLDFVFKGHLDKLSEAFGVLVVIIALSLFLFILILLIKKLRAKDSSLLKLLFILIGSSLLAFFIYIGGCSLL